VYCTDPHPVQELRAEIETLTEEITGDMFRDTVETLWFVSSASMRSVDLILNMC
jgi:hypothetical protein